MDVVRPLERTEQTFNRQGLRPTHIFLGKLPPPENVTMKLFERQGRGEMAVSNALGSNVQNVFFVLAFPIFLSVLARGDYTSSSEEILSSVLWMGATLLVVVLLTSLCSFILHKWTGIVCLLLYCIYLFQAGRGLLASK